jgi:Glycosyl transferase family 2
MRIVMTLIVRDEADVLEENLRVHRALGVDHFLVLDNGSTDGSAEILERWRAVGAADVTTDPDATTEQIFRQWQTRLTHRAVAELGADWLIHNDADEFWWPLEGNLRDVLAAVPARAGGVLAPRFEFVPRPGEEGWPQRLIIRERRATVRPKLAHRGVGDAEVGAGSHHVISHSLGLEPTAGRPSMRGLRRRPEQPRLIAPWERFPIAIWHLPLRSFEQYRSRLEIGLRIAGSTGAEALSERVRQALEPEEVRARWGETVWDDGRVAAGIEAGELAEDRGLATLLSALAKMGPDEIAVGSARVADRPAEELEGLRTEVAREAIAGLVHNDAQAIGEARSLRESLDETMASLRATRRRAQVRQRKLGAVRKRLRKTHHRLRRAQRRLERIEGHLWWRLRPRLPRRRR